MRPFLLLLPLLWPLAGRAQVKTIPLEPTAVPATLKHAGKVKQALRYTDRTGTYTVLATETGLVPAANPNDGLRADLYAYHYQLPATGAPTLGWQVHDFVPDCPLDLEARFLPGSLAVTDLDQNGTAEVWVVYRTTCRGDVSPSTQKIIMREGAKKYAVRGSSRIQVGAKQYDGGDYQLDAAFQAAPAAFRQQAVQLWQRYVKE
ncbi:M949_RS01915 family surface polysaccharide biosynthesis protein [Hymenobacter monticola]|uniref:Uncharacterized protein n=1 Tax=Hymenobacter monticola TaxID=1705399 RepID=A0ABY4AYF9_9BACT|nr:hypothetical protein [Hymenobacter monticola]UOE31927.1 hypothetical protein MTP16_12350 [Hymenobacter monticola]